MINPIGRKVNTIFVFLCKYFAFVQNSIYNELEGDGELWETIYALTHNLTHNPERKTKKATVSGGLRVMQLDALKLIQAMQAEAQFPRLEPRQAFYLALVLSKRMAPPPSFVPQYKERIV